MQSNLNNLTSSSLKLCGIFFITCTCVYAEADYGCETHPDKIYDQGLIESVTGFKYSETNFMKSLGIKFGSWTEIGFTGNPDDPESTNGPVTFNDGPNEFKLHQVYGFIEREVDTSASTINLGFRADLLYGTDARFSATSNFDENILNSNNERKLVFPQVYVDVFLPIGKGITATVGHFYTLLGHEIVPAIGNFFFSHAYAMQYGEPFTHTGALLSYPVNNNITVRGGVVSGLDAFFHQPADFLGGVAYVADDERTSIRVSLITGNVKETVGPKNERNRTMYTLVLEHDITDKLHYVLQHDLGVEEKTTLSRAAQWYGINQYLFYDVFPNLGAGLRMEWFRDDDGARVIGDGRGENFIGVTGGLNYTPVAGFTVRPEVRYDCATNNAVFDDNKDKDQVLLSISGIFRF